MRQNNNNNMEDTLKILKSHKQAVINANSAKEKIYKTETLIAIDNNVLSVELPDGSSLVSPLKHQGTDNGKEIYHTTDGCPVTISNSELFINLYKTHDMAVIFFLSDTNSEEPKSWFKRLFGLK